MSPSIRPVGRSMWRLRVRREILPDSIEPANSAWAPPSKHPLRGTDIGPGPTFLDELAIDLIVQPGVVLAE